MYRILIVEDDPALALELARQITSYGSEAVTVTDFRRVADQCREADPHLVLMDLMLPYRDGCYWVSEIRRFSNVPVVFLSSASDRMNIVMAINMGGDEFIAKPVDPMVLNAKLQAILRRTYELTGRSDRLEFSGAVLDPESGTLLVGGEQVELTKNECRILRTLLEQRGKVVSRSALMLRLWNDNCFVEENTLTVNVTRLRRKLEEHGLPDVIRTRPGSGYMIP